MKGIVDKLKISLICCTFAREIDMDNFVVETQPKEIVRALMKMSATKQPLTVWQNDGETRVIHKCFIHEVDLKSYKIYLRASSKDERLNFAKEMTFYFRGEERSVLFKQDVLNSNSRIITAVIPKEVRVIENRTKPRLHFGHLSNKSSLFTKQDPGKIDVKHFNVNVYDASELGLALIVPSKEANFLFVDDIINFSNIGGRVYGPSLLIEAKIIYIVKINFKKEGIKHSAFKIGVKFKNNISKNELNEI
jgi:hypothetical protein